MQGLGGSGAARAAGARGAAGAAGGAGAAGASGVGGDTLVLTQQGCVRAGDLLGTASLWSGRDWVPCAVTQTEGPALEVCLDDGRLLRCGGGVLWEVRRGERLVWVPAAELHPDEPVACGPPPVLRGGDAAAAYRLGAAAERGEGPLPLDGLRCRDELLAFLAGWMDGAVQAGRACQTDSWLHGSERRLQNLLPLLRLHGIEAFLLAEHGKVRSERNCILCLVPAIVAQLPRLEAGAVRPPALASREVRVEWVRRSSAACRLVRLTPVFREGDVAADGVVLRCF